MMLCRINRTHEHCKRVKYGHTMRYAHNNNKNVIANEQFVKPQKTGNFLQGQARKKSKGIAQPLAIGI